MTADPLLNEIFDVASQRFKRAGGRAWHEFFIDGCAFQADWLCLIHPELTRAYLLALADLCTHVNGAEYERARRLVDIARRELLEAFDGTAKARVPS
jgi:hypothetical protein